MGGWNELDTTTWGVITAEVRGKRPKEWVREPGGVLWLRKRPRIRSGQVFPYEPAIEWLMLRLATRVGLAAPESHPSSWTAIGEEHCGIVVRCFVDEASEELSSGAQVLQGYDAEYRAENWSQTVALVRNALEAYEVAHPPTTLLLPFAQMIAFDAWIGNADRHQENWGVVTSDDGRTRLAPMYDPAACLGVELDDAHPLLTPVAPEHRVQAYVDQCPSGFGDGSRLVKMARVVAEIRSWPEWSKNIRPWIASFESAMDNVQEEIVGVPEKWLPTPRKHFVLRMLRARLRWLFDHA
jgi:HipA-like protein